MPRCPGLAPAIQRLCDVHGGLPHVAQDLGLHHRTLERYAWGYTEPRPWHIRLLALYSGVTAQELIGTEPSRMSEAYALGVVELLEKWQADRRDRGLPYVLTRSLRDRRPINTGWSPYDGS